MPDVELCAECVALALPATYPFARIVVAWILSVALVGVSIATGTVILLWKDYAPLQHRSVPLLFLQVVGTLAGVFGIAREIIGENSFPCVGAPLQLAVVWAFMLVPWLVRVVRAALLAHINKGLQQRVRDLSLRKPNGAPLWLLSPLGLFLVLAILTAPIMVYTAVQLFRMDGSRQGFGCLLNEPADVAMLSVGGALLLAGCVTAMCISCAQAPGSYFRSESTALCIAFVEAGVLKAVLRWGIETDFVTADSKLMLVSSQWVDALLGIAICIIVGVVPALKARANASLVNSLPRLDTGTAFAVLLSTSAGEEAFIRHLQGERSMENWNFYSEADLTDPQLSTEDLTERVKKVYLDYVQPGAGMQINLPDLMREQLTEVVCAGPPYARNMFLEARQEVYSLMERDAFRRFTASESYRNLLASQSYRTLSQAPLVSTRSILSFSASRSVHSLGDHDLGHGFGGTTRAPETPLRRTTADALMATVPSTNNMTVGTRDTLESSGKKLSSVSGALPQSALAPHSEVRYKISPGKKGAAWAPAMGDSRSSLGDERSSHGALALSPSHRSGDGCTVRRWSGASSTGGGVRLPPLQHPRLPHKSSRASSSSGGGETAQGSGEGSPGHAVAQYTRASLMLADPPTADDDNDVV